MLIYIGGGIPISGVALRLSCYLW